MNVYVSFTESWMSEEEAARWIAMDIGFEKESNGEFSDYTVSMPNPLMVNTMYELSEYIKEFDSPCIVGNTGNGDGMYLEIYNAYRE